MGGIVNLDDLHALLEYEQGAGLDGKEIVIMVPGGATFEILSVNWDDETGRWVIVGDYLG